MPKPRFHASDRASDISEQDFWSALRIPRSGRADSSHLRLSISLGRRGKRDEAYTALGEHFRISLAKEWAAIADEARRAAKVDLASLKDTLNHKITVWHTQVIDFGPKIDWAPPLLLNTSSLHGFHYLFWLARPLNALIQTENPRVRAFIADIFDQYYRGTRAHRRWRDTIRGMVFDWLGIAGKLPRLLAAFTALQHTGPVGPRTVEAFAKTMMGFGRALDETMIKPDTSNAFSVAMRSLLQLARLFPEFVESKKWDAKAVRFLVHNAKTGFFTDGCGPERVWGYGTMSLSGLADTYKIAQRYGGLGRADKPVLQTIRRIYEFYAKTMGPPPNHLLPTYGDAGKDKGTWLLKQGRHFFPEGTGENLGVDRTRSYNLEPSGFAIMRNGDAPDSTFITISHGPFAGWHSHWDLLSMNLWSKGQQLLEEQCRFGPYDTPLDVSFRAPEAHNLVLIDGMVYDSRNVRGQDAAWHSDDRVDYFSAYHRAYGFYCYGRGTGPVSPNIEAVVRRTVLFVKDPGYAVVMDSVSDLNHPVFNRAISQFWHSPFAFKQLDRGTALTHDKKSGAGCLMLWAHTEGLHRLETGVDFAGDEVAHLGHAYDRYHLRARNWMPLGHKGINGFTTVLWPFKGKPPKVSVREVTGDGGGLWQTEAIQIIGPHGSDTITLNPERTAGFRVNGKIIAARAMVSLAKGRGSTRIG